MEKPLSHQDYEVYWCFLVAQRHRGYNMKDMN